MKTRDFLQMCAQTACGRLRYLSHCKVPAIAFYYNLGEISHSPTHTHTQQLTHLTPLPRQLLLDLPLDLGKCHGKFGDASYYRDRMHSEQTDILLYIYR